MKDQPDSINLQDIKAHLKARGIRYTRPRAVLYLVLSASDRPMHARALLAGAQALSETCPELSDQPFWLSTVYRALELFTKTGLVEKTVRPGDDQATYVLNRHTHDHYAVCTRCHRIFDLGSCPASIWSADLAARGFQMTGHRVEVYGICRDCDGETKPAPCRAPDIESADS